MKTTYLHKLWLVCLLLFLASATINAQTDSYFKDSLDGAFDVSEWVLTAHGFIPIPMLITEPALGGIGGALVPVFISRNDPYIDTVNGKVVVERIRPNLYALGAAYTANGSWMGFAAAAGVIKKWRTYYRLATGFANINMNFYRTFPVTGEQSYEFTIQTLPIYGQLIKQVKHSKWFVGSNYLFMQTNLKRTNPLFAEEQSGIARKVSRLNALVQFDDRDNIFTPDDGFMFNTQVGASNEKIGSDYNYEQVNSAAFYYVPITHNLIGGFRMEYQQVWNDVPFYLIPFVNLRGIPVARYQGKIATLGEVELRWDIKPRWSVMVFGGSGKATNSWDDYSNAQWHSSAGFGGRYLIARKIKLRMGFDIARGPEQWAYYIVFGTSWMR